MLRNIDVILKLEKECEHFLVSADEVSMMLDIEDTNLTELISEEDDEVLFMLEKAENIEKLLNQLTENLRTAIDYGEFDCESYSWCLAKVRHVTEEIENYFDIIHEEIVDLRTMARIIISDYNIMTQYAYDGDSDEE